MNTRLTLFVIFFLSYQLSFAQCGTFSAGVGIPGAMTSIDLESFGAPSTDRFILELVVIGGEGGNAPNGPFFAAFGSSGQNITASFEIPAVGSLRYITGAAGLSSNGGLFGGGGGGSAVWYDPDGISDNGDEVLLIVAAGGGGAHASSNASNPTPTNLADLEMVMPPVSAALAAAGETPISVGGAAGGGFGFDGQDAITSVVEGGMSAGFATVSTGGIGADGANGGAGFGGGGGGGQLEANSNMADGGIEDFHVGGGGGGYTGGQGGAYEDARDQPAGGTDRVFRAMGGGGYINPSPGAGVVKTGGSNYSGGGNGAGLNGSVSISCSDVVPVELVSFTAIPSKDEVLLEWTTLSESDNAGFEVQRSKNGTDWEVLNFVKGAGTSIETQQYKYADTNPFSQVNYYRLKQLDRDNSFEFSQILVIEMENKGSDLFVFPNPVIDVLEYQISNKNLEEYHTVIIYDWLGRVVQNYQQYSGDSKIVDMSKLGVGTYNVVVYTDSWQYTKMVVKQ